MNNGDTLIETGQQLRAALEVLQGRLTGEDREAVGALISRMIAANPMEGHNAEASPRLSFAALSYAQVVLGAYMTAQAVAKG
jgi:hypothetical protein